ncbi:PspC domain-containing protein [Corynebacterium riegelii]|uniref:PspC domain-containing protein n=1 Tax=Corynebacterium riegelii TaxID=156976 RepID=UPI002550D7F4|nr:PspC domain-containing protein [Corynebacterium riegelii]MDK7180858.1 PspC domain-containing protein [Corynebacterium riegelii]
MSPQNKWHRSQKDKCIAGVCAGVAEVYETSANTVRIIYVIATLCGVPMVAVYLLQWLIYPKRYNRVLVRPLQD